MPRRHWLLVCLMLLTLALGTFVPPASAVINPAVQPRHLFSTHRNVIGLRVTGVDAGKLAVTMKVEGVAKGEYSAKEIVLKADSRDHLGAILALAKDQSIVAFIGKGRSPRDVKYYVGGGEWYDAQIAADDAGTWQVLGNADRNTDPGSVDIMFAVYNGQVERLWRMVQNLARDAGYYPARPFTRFESVRIDKLAGSVEGVGLVDLNADGRLDLVATSRKGSRVYLQQDDGSFVDRTEALGLADVQAVSVSAADANGNGRIDLLLDGVLYLQDEAGRFHRSGLVPVHKGVLSAAFADLTNNGYPDVVLSIKDHGLELYGNHGNTFSESSEKRAFQRMTNKLGWDKAENGAASTGYFEVGDWDRDGRTDVLYLAGPGYLLLNRGAEDFEVITMAEEGEESDFGTAAMAPMVDPDRNAAIVLANDTKMLLQQHAEYAFEDLTRYGNEIQDDIPGLLSVVVEDLNADGTLDFYAGNRGNAPGFFCTNRGYASWMLEEKYAGGRVVPAEVYNRAVRGIAAGDVNGDGANDLLIGDVEGTLWLLRNRTLDDRPTAVEVSTVADEQQRIGVRIVTVRPAAKVGVVGAWLTLKDAEGAVVASRQIGGNVGLGCTGPLQAVFAVRAPGAYTIEIRYSDGKAQSVAVDLSAEKPRHQTLKVEPHVQPDP